MQLVDTVAINHTTRTVQPTHPEGDDYYGLAPGTNGTAAQTRRALAVSSTSITYRWVRYSGAPAVGVTLVPSGEDVWQNPWDGPGGEE